MRRQTFDLMPLRVGLLWGLLPAAGVSLALVLLYGGHVGILGKLYAFFGFWAWFTIPFGVVICLVAGAIALAREWHGNRWLRKEMRQWRRGHW